MLALVLTHQFKRDLKLLKKRNYPLEKLDYVISQLMNEQPLEEKFHDHPLTGNFLGFRECHIAPDWLLVYFIDHGELVLTASRTGTHSDIFS